MNFLAQFVFDGFSIGFIVVLVLFMLVGLAKGFFKSIWGLIALVGSLVLAFLLAKPVATWLSGTGLGQSLGNLFRGMLPSEADSLIINSQAELTQAIDEHLAVIPAFARPLIVNVIDSALGGVYGVSLLVCLVTGIAMLSLYLISGIVIFIIAMIIFAIVRHIIKKMLPEGGPSGVSRLLGMLVGLVKGAAVILILAFIVSTMASMNLFNGWIGNYLHLGDENYTGIAKWLVENNFLMTWLQAYLGA